MKGMKSTGLKLYLGQFHFRVWKNGFEYGNRFGGKVVFFPWSF